MMAKRTMHCTLIDANVEAMVVEKRVGRGAGAEVTQVPISCQNSKQCERTTFCRFVNPLTTRVPLTTDLPQAESAPSP